MSSTEDFGNISFDLPKHQSNVIKVIGVGGGGSNAINHMYQQGIKGVDFVICNTDAQALANSSIPNKIQLGVSLTEGLGAGANPEVGEQAAVESYEEIKTMLDTNTKMIFITAGMGGGTGTGAAPIIAKMAKELDILTVGIVTIPFQFEGRVRNEQAQIGVEKLRSHVDSLVVINNNKLREVYGNLGFKAGFSKADEVLSTASRGIAEVITHHYTQNIDLRDAKTVLSNSGTAIMGSANASGESRASNAIHKALDSPLLNDNKITGAKNVLLLIVSGSEEITIDEIGEINDHIQQEAGHSANIIMGVGEDEELGDAISVTVIATGFDLEQQDEITNTEAKKIIHTLEDEQRAEQELTPKSTAISAKPMAATEFPIPAPQKKEEPIEIPEEEVIKHTLVEEEIDHNLQEGILPLTQYLKNLDVEVEDVDTFTPKDDFVIINAQEILSEIEDKNKDTKEEKEDFALAFDMPLEEEADVKETPESADTTKAPTLFELEEDPIHDILVEEPIEVIPVNETTDKGTVRRYSLDDYMQEEERLSSAKPKEKEEDAALQIEKKTLPDTEEAVTDEDVDPIHQPISDILKARAAERRARMKEFNYRFRNNSTIDEIEKEPAYKRAGLDVNSKPKGDSNISRTSLSQDGNDDMQLRRNNSFLHDNVD